MSSPRRPPSVSDLARYGALLDQLRGVTWPARQAARFGTAGAHRSRLRGLSAEFTEYRPYRQGDDPRRIDWKLLARTDRTYLRITSDRATLGTLLVVDASASMAFPAGTLAKWRQACRLAVGLAQVAHAGGDPVGLVTFGAGRPARVDPRTRRGIVAQIARALESVVHDAPSAEPGVHAGETAGALRTPRIAIISDFLGDDLLPTARRLSAAGTEIVAVEVLAREELDPAARPVLATDPEDAAVRRALVAETRAAYLAAFGDWRRATARAWREAGATFAEVVDDEPAAHAVRRIVRPAVSLPKRARP